jgi:hypothetical protein
MDVAWFTNSSGLSAANSRHKCNISFAFAAGKKMGASINRAHLVQSIFKRSNNAEVPTTATDSPEQVGIFRCVRGHQSSLRRHHIGGNDVVDSQPEFGVKISPAAAQRQSGDADCRHHPLCRGQPKCLRFPVELA